MNEATRFALCHKLRRSELARAAHESVCLLNDIEAFAETVNPSIENTDMFSGHMYGRVHNVLKFIIRYFEDIGALTDYNAVVSA